MQRTLFFPLGHPEAVTEREIGHLAVAPERREGLTEGTDSVARSRRPKLYLVGIFPLFSSQFSPGVLSSGRTPVSHGSFLKTLCPQSHT